MGRYSFGDEGSSSDTSSAGAADFESARAAYRSTSSSSGSSSDSSSSSRKSVKSSTPRIDSDDDESEVEIKAKPGDTPRPIGLTISTESTHPIVIACDHTGSMAKKPPIILEKLGLLGTESKRYAPSYAISFALIGDTRNDRHGLQVRGFDSGPALQAHLDKLYPEGDGGDPKESYGVLAYYYLHHCDMPKAVKPIFILILDAEDHDTVEPDEVKAYIGDDLNGTLQTKDIFARLMDKFSVYIVSFRNSCREYWTDIVGEQRYVPIDKARDIVEILIGIIAGELGEFDDFEMRSSKRHSDRPDRVSRVGESLKSVKKSSVKSGVKGVKTGSEGVTGGPVMKSRKLI